MKYMRENLSSQYGFLLLQDKILEIATYVDKFCKKYGINYCLMGGSALGAKRHGGFIPWDDDLDIFMTPSQYSKFRDKFNKEGNHEKYYLQEWGAVKGMVSISKVRMNNTTYIEEAFKKWDIHQGIYIDIFILHICPNNKLQQINQFIWAKYVISKGLAAKNYNRHKGFLGFILKVLSYTPNYFLIEHGLKQVYKYQNQKTKYFCNFMGKAVFKNGIYKREYFEEIKYIPFEKVQLCVPVKLHEFLSDRFGNYMKLPSLDQIKWEQHAEFWDTEKDFREYLPQCKTFSDEKRLI